jgi:hypothetical protein
MSIFKKTSSDTLFQSINSRISADSEETKVNIRWKPSMKGKDGYAVIRLLPGLEGDVAFFKAYQHVIKNGNRWFVDVCPTTIGEKCPVCEHNRMLWNQGEEDLVRSRKRSLKYTSNILVVNDPIVPANNGQVFLFQYSEAIFNMIKAAMNPMFPGEKAFNPFDVYTGANLILKMMMVNGFRSYDKSVFEAPSAISPSDSVLDEIYNAQHIIMDQFKIGGYDEISNKYNTFLGVKASTITAPPAPKSEIEIPNDSGGDLPF